MVAMKNFTHDDECSPKKIWPYLKMLFVNEHFTAGIVYGVGETHPSEVAGLTTITFMEVCTVHWPWYGNIFGLVFSETLITLEWKPEFLVHEGQHFNESQPKSQESP